MRRPAGDPVRRLTRREMLSLGKDIGAGLAAGSLLPLTGCFRHREQADIPSTRVIAPGLSAIGEGSLRTHATNANILTGAAVDVHALRTDDRYRRLVAEQCSIISPENAMKWDALRLGPNVFEFADADYFVHYGETSDVKLRGHCLVWHQALPGWFNDAVYKGNAQTVLVEHINTVVGRYAGRMHSWDVVNEAINPYDKRLDGLRITPWLEMIGEDYIEIAFRTARQADPSALLTYNDYGLELDTYECDQKRAAVLVLLRRLKARNVPIDAVGVQSHLTAEIATSPTSYAGLAHFLSEVRGMGLQIFITEMDVSDAALPGAPRDRNRAVAATYNDYLHVVLANPSVKAVLTWGISGKHTWLTKEKPRLDGSPSQPLPFDTAYDALPAFYAMRDAYDSRQDLLAHPPDATVNPYAPFTPRARTLPDKSAQDVKDAGKKTMQGEAGQVIKVPSIPPATSMPSGTSLPSTPAPQSVPSSSMPAIPGTQKY